jgi:hypothetical protein
MFEAEHLLEEGRCGSAKSTSLLSIVVASLYNQFIPYNIPVTQPAPFRAHSVNRAFPLGDRECDPHTLRRLDASTDSLRIE